MINKRTYLGPKPRWISLYIRSRSEMRSGEWGLKGRWAWGLEAATAARGIAPGNELKCSMQDREQPGSLKPGVG